MIHLYTGNGKGKTTAAFGMAIRAAGQGMRVCIFQFLKPTSFACGEQICVKKIKEIKLITFNQRHPMFGEVSKKALKNIIEKDFEILKKAVVGRKYDMVIADELINVTDQNFIGSGKLVQLLKSAPDDIELILTGRGNVSGIEKYADYITEMKEIKHPFRKNKPARKAVEY